MQTRRDLIDVHVSVQCMGANAGIHLSGLWNHKFCIVIFYIDECHYIGLHHSLLDLPCLEE